MTMSIGGTSGLVFPDATTQTTSAFYGGLALRNRIINGAMMIDQRNAGASVSASDGTFSVDRWKCTATLNGKFTMQQNAGSVTPPVGFTSYLGCTSTAATSVGSGDFCSIRQLIEGFNTADLQWGTANAKTVTLSFWVYSSLTGTFGGSLANSAFNRSYPFSYTISSANTWTLISVTISGDTTGTWIGATNGAGIQVGFSLGSGSTLSTTAGAWAAGAYTSATGATSVVGTSGATFYITGVQLEKGSTATSFDYRPYGTELALCQRYYEKSYNYGSVAGTSLADGWASFNAPTTSTENSCGIIFKVNKRTAPTVTVYNAVSGASGYAYRVSDAVSVAITLARIGESAVGVAYLGSGNVNTYYYHWTASSEL